MNLYQNFAYPSKLDGYNEAKIKIPDVFYFDTDREDLKNKVKYIAKSPKYAIDYARYVLEGPFPEGEDAIATHAKHSYFYAKNVIKKRFKKGEKAIGSRAIIAMSYAYEVLNGPFPEGEDEIGKDYILAVEYVNKVLHGPFPKGEKVILASEYGDWYKEKFM